MGSALLLSEGEYPRAALHQEYAKVILRDVNMEDGSTLERTQTMLASRAKKEIVLQDQELLIRHHHYVAESYLKDPLPTPLD